MSEKKSSFLQDFRDFAMKGNVIDMAVGVVIGGAFGAIVSSLVNDLIMPLIGKAVGGVSLSDMAINLGTEEAPNLFAYGNFIQTILNFLIIALSIFCIIRVVQNISKKANAEKLAEEAKKKEEEEAKAKAEAEAKAAEEAAAAAVIPDLLREIRDSLRK